MAFTYSPKIVTDGLVFAVDAANRKSYTSSSDTWYDLSGNGNHGTLTNGPGFDGANGGSLVFDGSDDYVNFGDILNITTDYTVEAIIKINQIDSTYATCIINRQTTSNGWSFELGGQLNTPGGVGLVHRGTTPTVQWSNTPISPDQYFHIVSSYVLSPSEVSFYINGNFDSTKSLGVIREISSPHDCVIGIDGRDKNGYVINGNLPVVKIYNRALTPSEITQNYNALKSRFGLT